MKKFSELTNSQKERAVEVVADEIRTLISEGFIDFGKTLSESDLKEYAVVAAEEAHYAEQDDKIFYEIA